MPLEAQVEFTPLASLFGGILIGLAAVFVRVAFGRIAGIAGILRGALFGAGDYRWRAAFLVGLVVAPFAYGLFAAQPSAASVSDNLAMMALAGLLVGVGVTIGSGCTSGHGVCGLARLSRRSMAATATFLLTAIVTVYMLRHTVFGAAL